MEHSEKCMMIPFLIIQTILYALILTSVDSLLVWSSFGAIVLCFVYALWGLSADNALLVTGLFFTVLADFCLVVCSPIQQLWGMVFFLITQSLYALQLRHMEKNKWITVTRFALVAVTEVACVLVLRDKTDLLAMVSICYYANLLMNAVSAFSHRKVSKIFPIALVLFILCDTVIGLQVASAGYLPIREGSLLHSILFVDFNLAWLFYLPSQVLIALTARKHAKA